MDKNLLRYYMAQRNETNKDLARLLGITAQCVSMKINENGTEFRQGEISKIKRHYGLNAEQIESIFFIE